MELQKAKILLEKINALYNNMSADSLNVSTIERDLMKSYIQQFYEVFVDVPNTPPVRKAVEVIKSTTHRPRPVPPIAKVIHKEPEPTPPTPKPEPPIVFDLTPPTPPSPPPPKPAPLPPKVEEIAPPPTPPPPPPKPEPPKPKSAPVGISEEMEDLFAFNSARELSEKLSEMPLSDINKGMGLNERILTVNDLFNGDQAAFKVIVDTLNRLTSFDEAKAFLINNAANKYDWTDKGRSKKAKHFIKLVKRRYS